jgi:dipeptidyl aminopeptidase/acylaminoacyl peptidase
MRLLRPLFFILLLTAASLHARADAPPKSAQETRAAFLKLIDRPKVPLSARESPSAADDPNRITFSYATESGQRVPGILLKPAAAAGDARRPAVIVAHGTGGKKESELPLMKQLVAAGFIAVAIDARFHGERGAPADYNAAIARAFQQPGVQHPLYWDTVWDLMRLVDYLQSRPDIDPQRIGLMGISKGGIETYFTAAADERIAAAVPCIGVQSFRWALEHDQWHGRIGTIRKGFDAAAKTARVESPDAAFVRRFYQNVVPGIDGDLDGPVMLTLIAPRPLLIINGDKDDKTPLEGVNLAADAARSAYRAAGAEDRFKQIIEKDTGHSVTKEAREEAVGWFARWLGPVK